MRPVLLIFISLFICSSCSDSNQKEREAVRTCFDNYKKGILEDKGDFSIKWVDSNTIEYYSKIVDLTLNADSTELQKEPFLDRLMTLSVRHRLTFKDVKNMDGTSLLVYAIKSGMVAKNTVVDVEIGEITIDNNFAKGNIISKGKESPIFFQFNKETDQWKIDLTSIFPHAVSGVMSTIEAMGMTETEFINQGLLMTTGIEPENSIWYPLKE